MALRRFDRKFGAEFLASLPQSPGVYLVYDESNELIYVGKAMNLKRRLTQYRIGSPDRVEARFVTRSA